MYQPDYFDNGTGRVFKLLKSLYELKQSPLLWYRALDIVLLGVGWKKSQVNTVRYFEAGDDGVAYWVLVYFDDLLAASSSTAMLKELKELLEAAFELREISPIMKYLGLEIVRDRPARKLWLHHKGYADKLRWRFIDEEQGGRIPKTPISVDAYAELTFDDEEAQEREEEYRKLGSGLTVRSDQHWRKVDRCLAYLADTRNIALEFGGGPESLKLVSYVDAEDASNKQKRTSMGGYVFVYGGAAISLSSSRIKCVPLSSTKSEYVAATDAGKEGRRLHFLLEVFKQLNTGKPTVLRMDNKSAISIAEGLGLTDNLKHMERRYAWLQHKERGGRGAGGSGEAQAQGQPRDSAMAHMQPSLGPPRDEPRVFGLDKFNGDNFAELSFKMENIFYHYDLLEVMEGTEKRPENDPEKSPWVRKSAQGYLLLGQALGSSQIRHIKPFQREPEKGPKAWAALKGVHAPAPAAVAVVLERQMAALRIEEDEAIEEGVQKFFDLLTRLEGADLNSGSSSIGTRGGRGRGRGGRGGRGGGAASMKSTGNESESRDDRFPGQFFFVSTQAPAGPEKDEGFEEPAAVGKFTLHSLDYWVIDSGATYSMTPRADLLTELEPSPVKHVTSALGQRAEVKGMGKVMFKGADGKMVGLKNVLWVPNLAANLISVRRLQKAGMDTSSKGAKTYTARLGERILWNHHEDRNVYNEMWQIPVVPMPKERQVAASISTKGEAVGSGDGTNGRAKELESKKCNLGGTSKIGEHKESGAAAQKQHKGEENPKAAAEEYGENMWGTIASAAFSNPTSATGECDWLTLHRRMGHVTLPILQQLVKNEMVAGICVKGEPDEVLGCPTCMQAKFTRYPFSSSEATAKAPLDQVVMDVVGPLKLGAAGPEYFLTIVDVYTRRTWVYVLSKKSDVAETVKTDWLPMVERQQDRLLKKNGIRHSLTMPSSPTMNGIAERANRTITETARGLLIEAGLPDYFWPDAVRSACVAKNRALTHVGAHKWVPYVEWIGRKPKVDMLRVFGCMCMALVPKHLRHNKLGAKAIWAVHLGMAQNSKGWLLWDPFTKKFFVSRDCKFMENLMYKDWKAENEAKIGMRFGEVKSSGLEHVELPLELSSGSTTTRQSSLVNGGEEAKDVEEEEEEVQQVSERAPTLPSRTTSAPRIRVNPQQRQGLHVPAAEEEGWGKRRTQAPNRLTYEALGKPAKSAMAGSALIVGNDEKSDYDECAFVFFSLVEMPGEPSTLKEALESSDAEEWKKAMESELKSIEENGTWELVELPEGRKASTSKWLFKIKSETNGKIERYKSRLVAKGYQQKEKVGYKELFAPVVKPTTLRTLLAGATIKGWVVKQMDVTTAFLNGVLEEEWYLKLRGVLEEIGFTPSTADHSLFMLGEGEQRSFMVVYVDDILIFSPSSDLVKEVMLKLQDKFKCKALGDVSFYLGLHIERDMEMRCMRVHQRKYREALAANFGQSEGHVATPFLSGFKCVKGPEEESVGEEERRRFHSLVGSLMYAAVNTRPDVAFATRQLARVVQCPNKEQVAAGMRVAKYLGQTSTVGLQYSAAAQRCQKGADGVEPGHFFLTAFSDASFASEPEDMTSVGGFICFVGGGPTAWESKKQVDQALSSVESEYMAFFRAVREIVWQWRLLAELGKEQQGPTPLYCDSQGTIALAKNPVFHGLTKHMRVKWHWTRSMVAAGEVELHYMKTTRQPADMMTKRLVEQQHWKCCKLAGMALN
ncbi:unnamed protein product [Closterium sp. NIES-54]